MYIVEERTVGASLGEDNIRAGQNSMLIGFILVLIFMLFYYRLFGLAANAVAGWWWADPVAALVIAAVATREGVNAWNGENCCSPVPGDALEAESNCAAACDCTCC